MPRSSVESDNRLWESTGSYNESSLISFHSLVMFRFSAIMAFKETGRTLQSQRQYELNNIMSSYLPAGDVDPAVMNEELDQKLNENQQLYGGRVNDVRTEVIVITLVRGYTGDCYVYVFMPFPSSVFL